MNQRTSFIAPLLVVMIGVLVPLLLYVGGYFWLGTYIEGQILNLSGNSVEIGQRIYDHPWQKSLFAPAARLESIVTGRQVCTHLHEEFISPSLPP